MNKTGTIFLLTVASFALNVAAAPLEAWIFRSKITFSGYTGNEKLENFPALVVLSSDTISGFDHADCAAGGADIRFTDADGNEIPYEIDTWNSDGISHIWVRVPELSAAEDCIWLYWGRAGAEAPAYSGEEGVWVGGYEAVWHMNESNPVDATGNSNDGTGKGGVGTVAGLVGQAIDLDGISHYVDCGTGMQIGTGDATLSIWLKTDSDGSKVSGVMGKSVIGSSKRYSLHMSALQMHSSFQANIYEGLVGVSVPWSYGDEKWHLFTAVYDRSGYSKLYVDGEEKNRASMASQSGSSIDSAARFFIGAYGNRSGSAPESGYYFTGSMDEGRLMNVEVSPDWIQAEYQNIVANDRFISYGAREIQLMSVTGSGGIHIANNSTATAMNGTDFGLVLTNSLHVDHTFVITNQSSETITLTGEPPISLVDATAYFAILQQPGSTVLNPNDHTSFTIRFAPLEYGRHGATVEFATSLAEVPVYSFAIAGFGDSGAVFGSLGTNMGAIVSGAAAMPENGTDFGDWVLAAPVDVIHTFTITNSGTHDLELLGTFIDAPYPFSLVPPLPDTTIAPSQTTTLTVRFNPTSGNDFAANLIISNNTATSPFVIPLRGSAVASLLKFTANSYVDIGTPEKLQFANNHPITVEGWVKYDSVAGTQTLYSKNNLRDSPYTHIFGITDSGTRMSAYTGSSWSKVTISPTLKTGTWHHLAYSFDGTNVTFILNGTKIGQAAFSYANNMAHNVKIGGYSSSSDTIGSICEVRVWNRARNIDEIKATMNHPLSGIGSDIKGYWPLNEGHGTMVADLAVDSAPGSIVSATWQTGQLPPPQPLPNELAISASPLLFGEVTPPYGTTNNLQHGDTFTCSAPMGSQSYAYDDNWRARCTGYSFFTNSAAPPAWSGNDTSFTYTHNANYPLSLLMWQWQTEMNITFSVDGNGSISTNGGWYALGGQVAITATPASPAYYFIRWSGAVPIGKERDSTLIFPADRSGNITAHFGTILHVATDGDDANDGLSWETPLATINQAVAMTGYGSRINVAAGSYSITNVITIDKEITIRGVTGAADTILLPANNKQVFIMTHPDALVERFRITGSRGLNYTYFGIVKITSGIFRDCVLDDNYVGSGGGVHLNGGLVYNCVMTNNNGSWASNGWGGGAHVNSGVLSNSYICANSADDGGGVYLTGGTVDRCVITNNASRGYSAGSMGGGGATIKGGVLKNSLIANNRMTNVNGVRGGGVNLIGGNMSNCTIADNSCSSGYAGAGLYMSGGTVTNCIIYHNSNFFPAIDKENVYATGGSIAYSATQPLAVGGGNIDGLPDFINPAEGNYKLQFGSPCIDSGFNLDSVLHDLEGDPRPVDGDGNGIAITDMGCYEMSAPTDFICSFAGEPLSGLNSVEAVLTATTSGPGRDNIFYVWDLYGNGSTIISGFGRAVITNTYGIGRHTVRLTCTNSLEQGSSQTREDYINVFSDVAYVSPDGTHIPPFDTWAKAATNLHYAIDEVYAPGTVWVSNGTYAIANVISITRNLRIRGFNGARHTILKPNNGTQVFVLDNPDASIDGFRFTGSRGLSWAFHGAMQVRNGTLYNCLFDSNIIGGGGGVHVSGGLVYDCIMTNNAATWGTNGDGGGSYVTGGVVSNCLISLNKGENGGGVFMSGGTVTHCIITNNTATPYAGWQGSQGGGGVRLNNGTLANSLVANNSILRAGCTNGAAIMMNNGAVINCTITGNTGIEGDNGAGVRIANGSIVNTIIYHNGDSEPAKPNQNVWHVGGTITYSDTYPPFIGEGNISAPPLFMHPERNDYTLKVSSPCVNTGTNLPALLTTTDLSGAPRRQRKYIDMGAYECAKMPGSVLLLR